SDGAPHRLALLGAGGCVEDAAAPELDLDPRDAHQRRAFCSSRISSISAGEYPRPSRSAREARPSSWRCSASENQPRLTASGSDTAVSRFSATSSTLRPVSGASFSARARLCETEASELGAAVLMTREGSTSPQRLVPMVPKGTKTPVDEEALS